MILKELPDFLGIHAPLVGHTDLDARSRAEREEWQRASSKWPIRPKCQTSAVTKSVSRTGRRQDSSQGRLDGTSRAGIANNLSKLFNQSPLSSMSHPRLTSSGDHADKLRVAGQGGGQINCRARSPIISESKAQLSNPLSPSLSQRSLPDTVGL